MTNTTKLYEEQANEFDMGLYALTIILCIIGICGTLYFADDIDGQEVLDQINQDERRGKGVC